MRSYFLQIIFLAGFALFLNSCETDFTTIAKYEDITVVYGLLDQKDSNQFIKINKAYLSEGDVLTYAQDPDCTNYLYKLNVWIEEWTQDGDSVRAYICDTTSIYNKEPGQFYYPNQVLYNWQRPEAPIGFEYIIIGINDTIGASPIWLNEDNVYKLMIKNPESGKIISAQTNLVNEFNFTSPPPSQFINFKNTPESQKKFEWNAAKNGGKYEFEMRFYYYEVFNNSPDTLETYIKLVSTGVGQSQGSNKLSYYYLDETFYSTCNNLIPYSNQSQEDNVKDRLSGNVVVIVAVAEEEYALYISVNEPSTSIVQDKPQYSNIDNGIGIYSSRYFKRIIKDLHTESIVELKKLNLKFKL